MCELEHDVDELRERKQELDALWNKGLKEDNPWRAQIIAQEWKRKKAEYDELCELV